MPPLYYLSTFLYNQIFTTPAIPTTDCTGKTVIVTGSNVGLGLEAARIFVSLNCEKLILACRSTDKGERAKADIESTTGRKGVIDVWQLDLESFESVKAFAERAKSLKRIDVLLENAGVSTNTFRKAEGYEITTTINVISTFLLALLMIPKLQETGKTYNIIPTLTIVSSEVQFFTDFPERLNPSILDSLSDEKTARMFDRYNVSKLIEALICREIARTHPVDQLKVTLNFMNPGLCHSSLTRELEGNFILNTFVVLLKGLLARTTAVGGGTLVDAALRGPESHGKFLSNAKIEPCARLVEGPEGPELQRKLWAELSQKLNEIQPGVTKNLDA